MNDTILDAINGLRSAQGLPEIQKRPMMFSASSVQGNSAVLEDLKLTANVITSLDGYAREEDIPLSVSQLSNDAGYVTSADLSAYVKKVDLLSAVSDAFEGRTTLGQFMQQVSGFCL